MVVVKIKDERGDESWGLIELQGDLESRNHTEMTGKFIGDLHFTKPPNPTPILIVGHHILHGKVVQLEKPYALLEPDPPMDNPDCMQLQVKAIITKKIIFKTRPKPIIVSPESLKNKAVS